MKDQYFSLKDVAEINPRFNDPSASPTEIVSFVPMAAVSEVSGTIIGQNERALGDVLKGFTSFQNGDVIVAKITPCFENGKIALVQVKHRYAFGSTEFHVIRPQEKRLDNRYLYHFLRQPYIRREGEKKMTGSAGQRRVPRHFLESLSISLPPFHEQRRIAAILDKADALREKRRQAIAKLDTLLQSVFLEMFGDPMKNQKGWPWGKISDLCKDIVDCPHSTPTYAVTATAYACWRSSDIQNGYIDKTATKYVYLEEYNQRIQRTPPKKGDVIYCREGARFGNAARILDDEKSCLGQRMMLMRAAPSKGTPEYLWAFLNAKSTYQKMVSLVGGSASPHVNVKEIKHFAAPIPPFQLQEKFSMLVHLIDQMRERSHMSLDMLESLFSSLQQRAFTGQLFTEKSAAAAQQELFAGS